MLGAAVALEGFDARAAAEPREEESNGSEASGHVQGPVPGSAGGDRDRPYDAPDGAMS